MTRDQRARYLRRIKAHVLRQLAARLERLTPGDVIACSPAQRERFRQTLERMPPEIPNALLTPFRAALHAKSQTIW